MLNRLINR